MISGSLADAMRLRPAEDVDKAFLYALRGTTMKHLIDEIWGWDETWQRNWFDSNFPTHRVFVIEVDGTQTGTVWLAPVDDAVFIAELQVLPEHQGKSIGTRVLRQIIEEAARGGFPTQLAVFDNNPRAQRLYERLGFKETTREARLIQMQCDRFG